mmetsp:Transcript_47789/g.84654  ORF Transcript_47789/g.84654 Transcript_47789/m.84654 type:complete len:167 (-) Transcript_47789:5-505(-)
MSNCTVCPHAKTASNLSFTEDAESNETSSEPMGPTLAAASSPRTGCTPALSSWAGNSGADEEEAGFLLGSCAGTPGECTSPLVEPVERDKLCRPAPSRSFRSEERRPVAFLAAGLKPVPSMAHLHTHSAHGQVLRATARRPTLSNQNASSPGRAQAPKLPHPQSSS